MQVAPDYPPLTAAEFLDLDFGDLKAELDNGVISMLAGGSARHAEVATNILVARANRLRDSGCKPYSSDMATRTHDLSVRYPDVSVFCGRNNPANDDAKGFDDPRVLFDMLSATTARTGPHGWSDVAHDDPFDVPLPALGITLPHAEMFARD